MTSDHAAVPAPVAELAAEKNLGELRIRRRYPHPAGRIIGGFIAAAIGVGLIVLYANDVVSGSGWLIGGIVATAAFGLPAFTGFVVAIVFTQYAYLFDGGVVFQANRWQKSAAWPEVERVQAVSGQQAGSPLEFWTLLLGGDGPPSMTSFTFFAGQKELVSVECETGEPFDVLMRQRLESAGLQVDWNPVTA